MRLFIAVLFDDETIERLSLLRDALADRSERGSFSERENLHLTLDFLGECDAGEMKEAVKAIEETPFTPFDIEIGKLGFFTRDNGNTWFASVSPLDSLSELQSSLHSALIEHGLRIENRKYRPHITLGRRVVTALSPSAIEPITAHVDNISLMLSERGRYGMIYTPLFQKKSDHR